MTTWCPWPFRTLMMDASKTYKTCCWGNEFPGLNRENYTVNEAFYSKEIESIRQNLKNGIRDPNCTKCYDREDLGIESLRQQEIKSEEYDKEEITKNPKIEEVFLSLGNQCNLKCRTCNPVDSSMWVQEIERSEGVKFPIYLEPSDSKFITGFNQDVLPNLKQITFAGGEPLLMKGTSRILELLSPDVHVGIITNGTHPLPKILDKFSNLDIIASIDGIGKHFNYMRHPGDWETVKSNLMSMGDKLTTIGCTINAYNVYYIDEVQEFANQIGAQFYAQLLFTPEYLSVHVLPKEVRHVIADKLKQNPSPQKNKVIGYLLEETYLDWQSFADEVKKRDDIRGESFKDTFPEYYELLLSHGKTI